MKRKLSERQKCIMTVIREFIEENHYPPTVRDIQTACDVSSTSVVDYNLRILQREGYIRRQAEVSRGIELLDGAGPRRDVISVPVLGYIAAGEPIQVETTDHFSADEWLELNESLFRNPAELYALRVQGDSMIDASVLDGDIVILRHQERAENGEMVAAWIDNQNETTLKHFYLEGDQVRLRPANASYPEMFLPAADVSVKGKVVSVIRQLE